MPCVCEILIFYEEYNHLILLMIESFAMQQRKDDVCYVPSLFQNTFLDVNKDGEPNSCKVCLMFILTQGGVQPLVSFLLNICHYCNFKAFEAMYSTFKVIKFSIGVSNRPEFKKLSDQYLTLTI